MIKNKVVFALAASILVISSSSFAESALQSTFNVKSNEKTYIELPNKPSTQNGKILVNEFFSYGCPHCYTFFPLFDAWESKQPNNVVVKKVPISFGRPQWVALSKLYFTLNSLNLSNLNQSIFKTIHEDRNYLFSEEKIIEWARTQPSININTFIEVYKSKSVYDQVIEADNLANTLKVDGVPSIIVNNHYKMVIPSSGFPQLLENTSALIKNLNN